MDALATGFAHSACAYSPPHAYDHRPLLTAPVHVVGQAAHQYGLSTFYEKDALDIRGFWSAVLLRHAGMPRGFVERQCFGWHPTKGTRTRWQQIDNILASPDVAAALTDIRARGLQQSLADTGLHVSGNGAAYHHLDTMLRGAALITGTINEQWDAAVAAGQSGRMFVGLEVEFIPGPSIPNGFPQSYDSRDAVYTRIASRYTTAGYTATLHRGTAQFTFPKHLNPLAVVQERFIVAGQTYRLYHMAGTGGIMHRVDNLSALPHGTPAIAWMPPAFGPADFLSPEAEAHAYETLASHVGLRDADTVRALREQPGTAYQKTATIVIKATDDYSLHELALRTDGTAVVRPLNGYFDGDDPQTPAERVLSDAQDLPSALAALERLVRATTLYKRDPINKLSIEGFDEITVSYEEPPTLEWISPKTRPGDIRHLRPSWDALSAAHYVGTTPFSWVAVHAHMNLPLRVADADGVERLSIAPLLHLYSAYFAHEDELLALCPSHDTRRGWLTPTPGSLRTRFAEALQHDHLTTRDTILRLCADIAVHTRSKYTALNPDKYIAALLYALFDAGHVTPGETIRIVVPRGRHIYALRVTDDNILVRTPSGAELPLIRQARHAAYTTVEFRVPDTPHCMDDAGVYTIDADAIELLARFAATFGWKYGNAPFQRRPE